MSRGPSRHESRGDRGLTVVLFAVSITAMTATGITGDNSATWNPTITVAVPGGMAANVYSATITHSVA